MRDYLLDTNVWSDWFDPKKNTSIIQRIQELSSKLKLHISFITLGEIDFGINVMTKKEQANFDANGFRKFVSSKTPSTVPIDKHIAKTYGELRARLFEEYAPNNKKRKGLRPCQLVDPATSLELGIQENDLWIAAQAITRNLTLVTNDKLSRIREVAGDDLDVKNWTT